MTLAEAEEQRDALNALDLPGTLEAVVGQRINIDYTNDYDVFLITSARVAAYESADLLTAALYGQAADFAGKQVGVASETYESEFETKITELLG